MTDRPTPPMMKCGHSANSKGHPAGKTEFVDSCAICSCFEVDENPPDLTGRFAACSYRNCQSKQPSSPLLAFFKFTPDSEYDEFYCGCRGWD